MLLPVLPIISATTSPRVVSAVSCRPQIRPSRMTTTRSDMAKTSPRRWETKIIATPRFLSERMRSNSRSDSCSVRAAVGSSRMRSLAFFERARAMTTSCWEARSSEDMGSSGSTSMSKPASAFFACKSLLLTSTMPQRSGSLLRVMFSATLRSGTMLTS